MKRLIKTVKNRLDQCNAGLLMLLLTLPNASHATSIESILGKTHQYLSGSIARSFGLVVIVVSGYLCIAQQRLPKDTFVRILIGLGIIFGANSLYSTLIG